MRNAYLLTRDPPQTPNSYNDHAVQWLSGPAATPGTPLVYGTGPYKPNASRVPEDNCAATEGGAGGKCYFVDSEASNNWIALRVRNATHNFVFVQSFGANAVAKTTFVSANLHCVMHAKKSLRTRLGGIRHFQFQSHVIIRCRFSCAVTTSRLA